MVNVQRSISFLYLTTFCIAGGVEVQAWGVAPCARAPLGLCDRVLHLRKMRGAFRHLSPPQQPQLLQTQQQRILLFTLWQNIQDQNSLAQVNINISNARNALSTSL